VHAGAALGLGSVVGRRCSRAGGRWNIPGQAALYLSDSHATAIAEYQQNLPRPGALTAYDVGARAILDLADPSVRQAIWVDGQFLRQSWKHTRDVERLRLPCWDFVADATTAGWQGLRVPSVHASGTNLVLWRWNETDTPVVWHIDPLGVCHAIMPPGKVERATKS
jgi:RES domain-containing protein